MLLRLLLTLQFLMPQAFAAATVSAARQTQTPAISGRVLLHGAGLGRATVRLVSTSGPAFAPRTATTAADGTYAFYNIPGRGNYAVTVLSAVFNFSPPSRSYTNFAGVRTRQDYTAISHKVYSVGGRVADAAGGVGGVSVRIDGSKRTATTDALGNFTLPGLAAGYAYTLALSKPDFRIEPARRTVARLESNLSFSFAARTQLRGRVTDARGRGLFGINVTVDGPEAATTVTRADGSYSFFVAPRGAYTVTPSKEQGYYALTPEGRQLTGHDGSHVADFSASLSTASAPSYVLEFDGMPKTVDYGSFWAWRTPLPRFFWEFWAMPAARAGGGYMLSDGYGGGHALLFGFVGDGRYVFSGNIWDGARVNTFTSDEGPAANEWGHFAVGWDGEYVVTYFNGVPVGRTEFRGPRISPGPGVGSSRLLIGGSDHSNFRGRIAQVRGYEGSNPRAASPYAAFRPQTVFGVGGNLLSYYFRPAERVADLAPFGHDGRPHAGAVRGTRNGILGGPCTCPPPQFVLDPTAPDFSNPESPGQIAAPVETPAPAPPGALVFDSFARAHSTYVLGGQGGLGQTAGGSAGPLTWLTNVTDGGPQPFGILNGRAVLLADGRSVAWVGGLGGGDLDVRASRQPRPAGGGHNTGLSFRVQDANNFFFAYTSEGESPAAPKTLMVGYYKDGVRTELASGVAMPASWTTLRVVTTAAGTISVFADAVPVYAAVEVELSTAAGAGLYNNASGLGLTNRWDNFTILPAPQP